MLTSNTSVIDGIAASTAGVGDSPPVFAIGLSATFLILPEFESTNLNQTSEIRLFLAK